jgi:hypothetical protein
MEVGTTSEALGVETLKFRYLLESPHPEYAALFYQSKAPVSFATWLLKSVRDDQRKDLTLEALASMFSVSSIPNFIECAQLTDGC